LLALIKNPLANKLNINSHLQWKDWGILGISVAALVATLTVRDSVFRETLRYSIQGLALVSIFYYSIGNYKNTIFKPLNHFVLTKIGKLSYSIYLIHYFLIENLTISLNSFILKIILITVLALTYAILIND
jgi:peptidoglycan/LPS O-acetylase OafA/YrhL